MASAAAKISTQLISASDEKGPAATYMISNLSQMIAPVPGAVVAPVAGFYAALGLGNPPMAQACLRGISDFYAYGAALVPAAEGYLTINSDRGRELAALLFGQSPHQNPPCRFAQIFVNSTPAELKSVAASVAGMSSGNFTDSDPDIMRFAQYFCGMGEAVAAGPAFDPLVYGMLKLLVKAHNFSRLAGLLMEHVVGPGDAFSVIADRLMLRPRQLLGLEKKAEIREVTFKTPNGNSLPVLYHERANPFGLFRLAFLDRWYEPSHDYADDMTIFDCGAHIGLVSAWLLERYPNARIHAFEPGSRNYECLSRNAVRWSGDGRLAVVNKGLWNTTGTRNLFQHRTSSVSDSMFAKWQGDGSSFGMERAQVETVRLDEYMREHGVSKVDLMKLNVEGAELKALHGLGPRLVDVGTIIGDLHLTLVSEAELVDFLQKWGFHVHVYRQPNAPHALFEAINEEWES